MLKDGRGKCLVMLKWKNAVVERIARVEPKVRLQESIKKISRGNRRQRIKGVKQQDNNSKQSHIVSNASYICLIAKQLYFVLLKRILGLLVWSLLCIKFGKGIILRLREVFGKTVDPTPKGAFHGGKENFGFQFHTMRLIALALR